MHMAQTKVCDVLTYVRKYVSMTNARKQDHNTSPALRLRGKNNFNTKFIDKSVSDYMDRVFRLHSMYTWTLPADRTVSTPGSILRAPNDVCFCPVDLALHYTPLAVRSVRDFDRMAMGPRTRSSLCMVRTASALARVLTAGRGTGPAKA